MKTDMTAGGASIYDRILRCKAAVVEPRDAALFPEAAQLYKTKVAEGGAVFFAVCRHAARPCVLRSLYFPHCWEMIASGQAGQERRRRLCRLQARRRTVVF